MKVNKILMVVVEASSMPPLPPRSHSRIHLLTLIIRIDIFLYINLCQDNMHASRVAYIRKNMPVSVDG